MSKEKSKRERIVADKSTMGGRLRLLREERGLTQEQVAVKIGVSKSSYSGFERSGLRSKVEGGRDPDLPELKAIARFYKVPITYLDENLRSLLNERESTIPVRIVGYVGASTGEGALYGWAQDQYDEVERPTLPVKAVAVEIKGKSFGPLMDGMLAFYEDVRRPVTEDLIGSICVLGLADNRILLKKIARAPGGKWRLLSNSSDEAPIETSRVEWAARMIAIAPR